MNKKVLIIEDNDDIRESTAEVLDLAGYQTFTAKHGKLGVEMALNHLPDVILCDIMMPELDGYVPAEQKPENGQYSFYFHYGKNRAGRHAKRHGDGCR
jgi:CheY-like chemotaxis protein